VLAAGVKTESKNDKPLAVQSVTLLVKPKGAEDLALARSPDSQGLGAATPREMH